MARDFSSRSGRGLSQGAAEEGTPLGGYPPHGTIEALTDLAGNLTGPVTVDMCHFSLGHSFFTCARGLMLTPIHESLRCCGGK